MVLSDAEKWLVVGAFAMKLWTDTAAVYRMMTDFRESVIVS